MNTPRQSKPILKLRATFIGPIMSLDSDLSDESQNLIFATNGTGKSFLSRAFTLLDKNRSDPDSIDPSDIVSEESTVGEFRLSEDTNVIADIRLDTNGISALTVSPDHIFHVFSADYVENELKKKSYHQLDGSISHEIILGKPNADLIEKEEALTTARDSYTLQRKELSEQLERAKNGLKKNFAITASLGEFKNLDLAQVRSSKTTKTEDIGVLKKQYEKIKSLPEGATINKQSTADDCFLDATKPIGALQSIVRPSAIEEKVRQKIIQNPDFFKFGVKKFERDPSKCHFCTQDIQQTAATAIGLYKDYFEDEEAAQQDQIRDLRDGIKALVLKVGELEKQHLTIQLSYDELKMYFPELSVETLDALPDLLGSLNDEYTRIDDLLVLKSENLTKVQDVTWAQRLTGIETAIRSAIEANNEKISNLQRKLLQANSQRQEIQRNACYALREDFRTEKATTLANLASLESTGKQLAEEVEALRRSSGDKVKARDKVAGTFEHLLEFIFGEKYTFDAERFVVQRNKSDMTRGGDRTLSDGEKAVLGFCYYLAQTHLKVTETADYTKVFFVIDDPVSSVSFDYIYSIAQIIKSLRLKGAELVFDSSPTKKPRMLLLTHNDYFYNLASTNNLVDNKALFQLTNNIGSHTLNSQKQFVAPHIAHMREVSEVAAKTRKPTHQTPNSIRCVIEGMWRFCKPDLGNLADFITYVSNDLKIEIKSMLLLNNLSHGAKMYSDATFETDVVAAAKEAMSVVEKLAPGQLKRVA